MTTRSSAVMAWLMFAAACGDNFPPEVPPEPPNDCTSVAPPCAATDTLGKLGCVPGLVATPMPQYDIEFQGFHLRYVELALAQPVDHDDPSLGTFTQHAVLYLRAEAPEASPVVFYTSGYHLSYYLNELAFYYDVNHLEIEHRFFGPSTPSPRDWSKLSIRQQALDEHHWVTALRWIFEEPWVNTGASKGGETATYHRHAFSCDFTGTVAYVAPFTTMLRDPRYEAFLQTVGGDGYATCRANLVAMQRHALIQRDAIVPMISGNFSHVGGPDVALEHAVIEAPWVFWQYYGPDDADFNCGNIPGDAATAAEVLAYLDGLVDLEELSGDGSLASYAAYYYQAATEQGDYLPPESHLADLLRYPGTDTSTVYAPSGVALPYDNSAVVATRAWVADQAEDMAFIYGEYDPWTVGAIDDPTRASVQKFTIAGANHGASISDMPPAMQAEMLELTSGWLGRPLAFKAAVGSAWLANARVHDRPGVYDARALAAGSGRSR